MPVAIDIQNLGKQYRLRGRDKYLTFREALSGSREKQPGKETGEFWALKDVSFNVEEGDRLGIIGRNGAGKSTLLKVCSRITPPTTGRVVIHGRIGSLLEVGTGFHNELSGRENIFLNGSILGLKRSEIKRQLADIIEFSGVEKFIDSPLKHYSTGMQMRLAFSVAAHLQTEILLIDEVLAVGDLAFQKKCIGKMEEISRNEGRTILFVSHNMGAIQSLCNKALFLSQGELKETGSVSSVIEAYLKTSGTGDKRGDSIGNRKAEILSSRLSQNGIEVQDLFIGYPATLDIRFRANEDLQNVEVAFNIVNNYGEIITHCTTLDQGLIVHAKKNTEIGLRAYLSSINPAPGSYSIDLFVLENGEIAQGISNYTGFTVLNSDKVPRPDGFPTHVKTYTATTWKIE